MPSRTMSATQVDRFVRSMEDQGVGVTRTKKGLLLRLPDGESTSVHFTNSDVRAEQNLIARLRRAGVRHPDDPRNVADLPENITNAVVADRSKRKIMGAIEAMGYPEYVRVVDLENRTGQAHITITRALYAMGFIPIVGKRNARDWKTPEDILALRPESPTIPEREATPEEEAAILASIESPDFVEVGPPAPINFDPPLSTEEAEAYVKATDKQEEREFIDTHDSWVLDLDRLAGGLFVDSIPLAQLKTVLEAAGLNMEIRVWRA